MFQKVVKYILSFLILQICSLTVLFAEELVIPVIKSPYPIDKAEWTEDGNQFAVTTNSQTYVRDSLDLTLKDNYPQQKVTENFEDFPAKVIAYGTNKNGVIAAACADKKLYVYNPETQKITQIGKHNTKAENLKVTDKNQILIADSEKSAGLYDLTGEKLKTFAAARKITSVEMSADGETVILGQSDGSMHFFSSDSSREIGYVPVLNSSGIKSISINKDSSKVLETYADGSVFYVRLADALFSPESTAPAIKNFPIAYNALTAEADETAGVQEFSVKEIDENEDVDTEFIASTRENKDNQKFEINEKKEKGESVLIKKNQKDKSFTYTEDADKDVTLSKKYPDVEGQTYVQEFNQDLSGVGITKIKETAPEKKIEDNPGKVTEFPEVILSNQDLYGQNQNVTKQTQQNGMQNPVGQGGQGQVYENGNNTVSGTSVPGNGNGSGGNGIYIGNGEGTGNGTGAGNGAGVGQGGQGQAAGNQPVVVIVNGNGTGTEAILSSEETETETAEETPAPALTKKQIAAQEKAAKDAEKKAAAEQKKAEEQQKKEEAAQKKAEEKAKKETEKKPKEVKTPEEIKDLKTLFKDGHGVMVNAGVNLLQDPYTLDISLPMGYRNYDLIRPFYFGGTIEPYFALPSKDFPYTYTVSSEKLGSPSLIGARFFVPAGFCIYPLRNSLEIYTEMGLGVSVNQIWNRKFGSNRIATKMYPAFYGNLKVGAAWDFLNISICGNYDAILGFSFGLEAGAIVNIGGSRTIGSLKFRNEKTAY